MIAVDTNILVYAHRADSEWHAPATAVIKGLAEGAAAWAIPWPCLHEFVAIVTHARIYRPPSTLAQALAQVRAWLESPSVVLLSESPLHFSALEKLLVQSHATGPRVHDARIAALCVEHEVEKLWSADRDFARFAGLSVENPLISTA